MFRRKLAIGIILILGLLVNAVALGAELSYQVDRSEDDAFKSETGAYFEASPYVAITDPNYGMFSYFLFRNVTIYNSRIINNATLSVYTTSGQDADLALTVTIYGLEVYDGGLLDRISLTTANVVWNVSQVRGIGTWHNVTVTSIVQELIDRFGWDYGDNLAFEILATSGALRQAVAFDYGTPPLAAMLYLTYGEAPPPPPGLPPDAEYNQTVEGYDIYSVPGTGQVTTLVSSMIWDDTMEVYPFQGKTAYVNTTDKFYIFGLTGDSIGYHFRDRTNLTWSSFQTLYTHVAGDAIYSDFFVDRFGKLHVGWIWTFTDSVYYMKFDLLADGSATNYTGRQTVDGNTRFPSVVISVDSEGYPYMAYATKVALNYGGRVAWSTLNNGTWLNHGNSPESSETNLGVNPPNEYWYVHELVAMGNRTMNLIVNAPDYDNNQAYTCSKRLQNSGPVWTGEGEFLAGDRHGPNNRIYAISGASGVNISDPGDGRGMRNDDAMNDFWNYNLGTWGRNNNDFGGNNITVMVADEQTGRYVAIAYKNGQNETYYSIIQKNNSYTTALLRTFDDQPALWGLVGHQNPQSSTTVNKTIISYAWRDDATITFYHDWFYLEDGPTDVATDPYFIAFNDGPPLECDTLDCLIDLIEGDDPDPQDPEPSPWEGSPALLGRFAMRRYFLMIGWAMVWGPIWLFCYRRPSGYLLGAAFIFMLIGLGLLLQVPYV